jgi:hypothetical protein
MAKTMSGIARMLGAAAIGLSALTAQAQTPTRPA